MATRATISYLDEKTLKYHSIYLHNDGYVDDAGKILKENYFSLNLVKKLVALGSISVLGYRLEPMMKRSTHSFDAPETGTTVAYHRDRGDEWADVEPLVTDRLKKADRQEFNYLFLNGEWHYIFENGRKWQPVP